VITSLNIKNLKPEEMASIKGINYIIDNSLKSQRSQGGMMSNAYPTKSYAN
jgi:hypothetical protein